MLKKVYSCEICRDQKPAIDLYGIRFKNNRDFEISCAASTDGVHICGYCMGQLRINALPDGPTPSLMET